jgi:hypothetical protein
MPSRPSAKTIDLQELITGAATLELKALRASVECWQVWIDQAAKLSLIAGDTLQALQDKKFSASDSVRRLSAFSAENTQVLGDLSGRLGKSYYSEIGRLAAFFDSDDKKPSTTAKAAARKVARRKTARTKA